MAQRQSRAKTPIQIAVGGGKGGSGGTLLSQALSVCAALRGFKVALRGCRKTSNNSWIYRPRHIAGVDVFSSDERIESDMYDFIFTDVTSRTFTTHPRAPNSILADFGHQNMLVVPVDLACESSIALKTHALLCSQPKQLCWVAVQVCSQIDPQTLIADSSKTECLARYMARVAIVHRQKPQLEIDGQFCPNSQQDQFHDLFDEICERLQRPAQPVNSRQPTAHS